MATFIQL